MGRKVKIGLDYFPLYHDFFTSKKIKALRRAQGHIGILTYLNLLCRVYDNGYYYKFDDIEELSMDIAEEIANEQLRRTATSVTETINYLVKQGILDEGLFEQNVISGEAMQEQYVISSYKAKRKIVMDVYLLIDVSESIEKIGISSEETGISSEESTQRKGKEKTNKNNSFLSLPGDTREDLTSSRVNITDTEKTDLLQRMAEDDFNKYVGIIESCERTGKRYTRKSHYEAILEMAKKDGVTTKNQHSESGAGSSFDTDQFFEAALERSKRLMKEMEGDA